MVANARRSGSKLATHRMLSDETAAHSLGRVLGLGRSSPRSCIAPRLAAHGPARHRTSPGTQALAGSTLVLYDLTSTRLTGRCCPLRRARAFARRQAR